jgi:hypothetical protein
MLGRPLAGHPRWRGCSAAQNHDYKTAKHPPPPPPRAAFSHTHTLLSSATQPAKTLSSSTQPSSFPSFPCQPSVGQQGPHSQQLEAHSAAAARLHSSSTLLRIDPPAPPPHQSGCSSAGCMCIEGGGDGCQTVCKCVQVCECVCILCVRVRVCARPRGPHGGSRDTAEGLTGCVFTYVCGGEAGRGGAGRGRRLGGQAEGRGKPGRQHPRSGECSSPTWRRQPPWWRLRPPDGPPARRVSRS